MFDTSDFFRAKAERCKTAETKYRRIRRAIKKETRFDNAWEEQLKLSPIPEKAQAQFHEVYSDAFSRISMLATYERNSFGGKPSTKFVGPNLKRMIDYLIDELGEQENAELSSLLKDLKSAMRVDSEFCTGGETPMFHFLDYVHYDEKLTLRDITTHNVLMLKKLVMVFPKDKIEAFKNTLATEPWLRATDRTYKLLWQTLNELILKLWTDRTGLNLKGIHLGKREKEVYVRFKLASDSDDKWHTAETEAVARIAARAFNSEIIDIQEVDPAKHKSFEIRDEREGVIEALINPDGDWGKH